MMDPRITRAREEMEEEYQEYMSSKFSIARRVVPAEASDASLELFKNSLCPVPSVVNVSTIELSSEEPSESMYSVLQAQIDELEMNSILPDKSMNIAEFEPINIEPLNQKQKKMLPNVKNQAHKTELDAFYHEFKYNSSMAENKEFEMKNKEDIGDFRICNGKIIEDTKFDINKLYYEPATSKLEGELFGLKYEEFSKLKEEPIEILPKTEFDSINGRKIVKFNSFGRVKHPDIIISSISHPADVTSEKFVKDELQKLEKATEKVEKKPKEQRERAYFESYDRKMVTGRKYEAAFNMPGILEGFKKNSTEEQFDQSCFFVPSLCHALIAIIAVEQVNVKLREEDIFFHTCPREMIVMNRQALCIRDILRSVRDMYPKLIDKYIPKPLKCFESIMTALLEMCSPDEEQIAGMEIKEKEVRFMSKESIFDTSAGMPEIVIYPSECPAPPCQPPVFPPSEKVSAIICNEECAIPDVNKADKSVHFDTKVEPAEKAQAVKNNSFKLAEDLLQNIQKVPQFPASQLVNNTELLSNPMKGDYLKEKLESNVQLYANSSNLNILYNSGNTRVFENVVLEEQDLEQFDIKSLYETQNDESQTTESEQRGKLKPELNSDSEDDVAADPLPYEQQPDCAVLALSSPLLGEFMIMPSESPSSYFGVDALNLAKIAVVTNHQLDIDVNEIMTARERFESGEFKKVNDNAYTLERKEFLQKSKQKMANSLTVTKENYSDAEKYMFRAEERLRYFLLSNTTFPYIISGVKSISMKQKNAETKMQSYKYLDYQKCMPQQLSKIAAVQDAACRLPGKFGSKEDILEKMCDSNFSSWRDSRLEAKVSCALDRLRLHFVDEEKRMRLAMFDEKSKIWVIANMRLQICMGDYYQEEWPADLYEMYEKGSRGGRMLGRQ